MLTEIGYIQCVDKGRLADYFERGYLEYQLANGRISLTEFAERLKITKGYLSLLMEGKRITLSYHKALFIAETLGDYEILDVLGYERPACEEDIETRLAHLAVWLISAMRKR